MAGDKNINIGVGADVSGLKTGMNEAAKMVQDAGLKMHTAAKDATAKTEQSFSNLRQAYRATAKDAYEIALNQGTNSAAFLEATKRAGEFKDELDLVNTKIAAFSSDTPVLTSALGVGQGLAGAFAAAQGAMALFGGASKEVEQALLKVQGAMALLQGLQAIGALGDAMSAFGAVIKVQVIPALMTMQGAIMATGIGAVVVAVIALTQAASAYNDQIDREIDLKKELDTQNKLMQQAVDKAKNAQFKTEELKIRAMKDGTAKQIAEFDLRKRKEIQSEKETFEASNKTYFDSFNLKERVKYIEGFYKQQTDIAIRESQKVKDAVKTEIQGPEIKRQDAKFNQISSAVDLTKWGENLEAAKIPLTSFVNTAQEQFLKFEETTRVFNENINQIIEQGVSQTFIGMGETIGEALAGSANFAEAAGQMLLGTIGTMATQLGQLAIGTGLAVLGIKKALLSLNPVAAIAAGVALVALGSYVSAKSKSIAAGGSSSGGGFNSGGGGYSANNGFSGFTPQNNDYNLTSRLVGTDLLLSVEKSNKRMERVR